MPRRSVKGKPKNSYRRRRYTTRRKRLPQVTSSMMSLGRFGFPKKIMCTHEYSDIVIMTNTAGSLATFQFSANGMFDPNITSTGHQPMFFDQLSALYLHYNVIGSKITFTFTSPTGGTTTTTNTYCGAYIDDDTASLSNINALLEQDPYPPKIIVPGVTQKQVKTLKWSAKKTFGGSVLSDSELQGTASANPTEQSYYTMWTYPVDGSSTVSTYATVKITYIAIWSELRPITTS